VTIKIKNIIQHVIIMFACKNKKFFNLFTLQIFNKHVFF